MMRRKITMCYQAPTIKFSSRNSSTVWDFTVKSLKLLKGVTLLGVEHLQHFAIADVALVSKEGDFKYESKGQECLLKEDEEEGEEEEEEEGRRESGAESTTPPPPTIYKYSFKLKFHTKIFGTFKQTLVLDFGVRPLLSKVGSSNKSDKLRFVPTLFQTVTADVVACSAESDLQSVRESIISISDPWDATNSEIAKFETALPQSSPDEEELLATFPAPQPALVANLATRWHHLHKSTSLALPHCLELPSWHYQLVLTWYLHQPESHQLSLTKRYSLTQ